MKGRSRIIFGELSREAYERSAEVALSHKNSLRRDETPLRCDEMKAR